LNIVKLPLSWFYASAVNSKATSKAVGVVAQAPSTKAYPAPHSTLQSVAKKVSQKPDILQVGQLINIFNGVQLAKVKSSWTSHICPLKNVKVSYVIEQPIKN